MPATSEIDWISQPWTLKTDSQLAKKLKVSRTKVWEMRRMHSPETQRKWRGGKQEWRGQDWTVRDADIAKARGCSESTVNKARRWLSPEGVKAERKPGSGRRPIFTAGDYNLALTAKENAFNMGCSEVHARLLKQRKLAIRALKKEVGA